MKRIRIITGHYGSGKSELSVNMVMELRKQFDKVAIVDLDIANPYFRSRERQRTMEEKGIKVFHNSFGYDITQDLPALSAAIKAPLEDKEFMTVVDAGGDDSGARVLHQFKKYFLDDDCEMLFVINGNRPETSTVDGCIDHMNRIMAETGLEIKGILNNTHLLSETSVNDIIKGVELCKDVSAKTGIPFVESYCDERMLAKMDPEALVGLKIKSISLFLRPSWLQY